MCLDIDDCISHPCQNGARCVDLVGDFKCECTPGHEGVICEINIDECQNQPCLNDADCVDQINDFKCLCKEGYTGKTCSDGKQV